MSPRTAVLLLVGILLAAGLALAAEPDWFTRVREKGLTEASKEEVARHEKGVITDSLHVGECYYNVERYDDGLAVFRKLLRYPDRNYAAAATVRVGEGLFHLGKKVEAKETFSACLVDYPDAWLDGSIAERCHAWLKKLEGKLQSPDVRPDKSEAESDREAVEAARKEVKALAARLAELKELLRKLLDD